MRAKPVTILLAALPALVAGVPAFALGHGAGTLHFEVLRDGSPIGTHVVRFREEGEVLTVETEVRIAVTIAFITVYRYEQDRTEVLRDGRTVTFYNHTNDDGAVTGVNGRAVKDGMMVVGPEMQHTVPADMVLSGYWNHQTVDRTRLLDSGDGIVLKIAVADEGMETVTAWGREVEARRYVLTGDLEREVWYDAAGIWVRMRLVARDGSIIEYRLMPEDGAGASDPSPAPSDIDAR